MLNEFARYVTDILGSYSWIAVLLELALVSFVVYSVMRFLRGTGGEILFKGIVFLLLGFWGISFLEEKLQKVLNHRGFFQNNTKPLMLRSVSVCGVKTVRNSITRNNRVQKRQTSNRVKINTFLKDDYHVQKIRPLDFAVKCV